MRSGKGGPSRSNGATPSSVILPTFKDKAGTHVNVSGAAVAKNAPNKENAVKLLEFLASQEAQEIYAKANFEYPVRAGVAPDPIIAELGTLTVDPTPLTAIAKDRKQASELVDVVGFDG
jgi:iron(III) transport system substrate-binding protein